MIPVNIPSVTQDDIDSVVSALRDGWISGEGPVVQDFEFAVASKTNRKHGVSVSNGSDALDLAFAAIDLQPGDEVILPTFTIISCLAPILRMGLVPVFIDSEPGTWNMDTTKIRDSISERTRAILAVHIYGLTVDFDPILSLAKEFNLFVIEDAAEAQGLTYKGHPCGSLGDLSTFSFYANKNLTTGEGGMVLTDNDEIAERLKYLRNLTFKASERFVHEDLGWNMRLSSLQSALGKSQLGRLDWAVSRRKEIARRYRENLEDLANISFQDDKSVGGENCYWVFGVLLSEGHRFDNAKKAMEELASKGVGTRPFFYPLHLQPVIDRFPSISRSSSLPVAENLYARGFYLPNGLGMSDSDLEICIQVARKVLR